MGGSIGEASVGGVLVKGNVRLKESLSLSLRILIAQYYIFLALMVRTIEDLQAGKESSIFSIGRSDGECFSCCQLHCEAATNSLNAL